MGLFGVCKPSKISCKFSVSISQNMVSLIIYLTKELNKFGLAQKKWGEKAVTVGKTSVFLCPKEKEWECGRLKKLKQIFSIIVLFKFFYTKE